MTESTIRHIHMAGICGVGMAPVAVLLKDAGYRVTGSDSAAFPPMSEVLAEAGISVREGFLPEHLHPAPDLVVIGNALTRSNPQAVEAERLGLRRTSFPAALAEFFLADKRPLVVAGTHGKTTTTGMLAHCLRVAGLDPGYLIGGLVRDLGRLAHAGGGEFFAVEGDEYDTAYFDKGPKFLHYRPSAAIVTSLEFDHADIYRDVAHVQQAFRELAELLPAQAPVIASADYPYLGQILEEGIAAKVVWYGQQAQSGWQPRNLQVGTRTVFDITYAGSVEACVDLGLPGMMNALNAVAVFALCRELGVDTAAVVDGLASYRGAARRQEVVGEADGVTVIDDFAHHPTAVAATLAAIGERFRGRTVRAVFEPRSNTSRRAVFQQRYAEALAGADRVALSAVYAKANDPLAADEMLSTERLINDLRAVGVEAWSEDGPEEILQRLLTEIAGDEVVVCMSNGAFAGLPRRLLAALLERRGERGGEAADD